MQALSNIKIIGVLFGKWKHIFVIAAIAVICGVIISSPWIMKPRYKSEAVVYPANLGPYSMETPTEQLMQLLQSKELKRHVLLDQKLWENYKLDTLDPLFDFNYTSMFDEHVKFNQTRFESVIIEVFDQDPKKAQSVNRSILKNIDFMVKKMHDDKTREFMQMFSTQLAAKKRSIDSVDRVLGDLRTRFGIMDYRTQVKEASRSYYKALAAGKSQAQLDALKMEMKALEEKGGQFRVMDEMLHEEILQYQLIKQEYDNKIRDLNKKFTYTSVVADPSLPVKKAWPVRWIVVLVVTFASVFLGCVFFIITDRIRKLKNNGS